MSVLSTEASGSAIENYVTGPLVGRPRWEYYNGLKNEEDLDHASLMMKDGERAFVTDFIGKTFLVDFDFEQVGSIYIISEDDVNTILDSIQVEIRNGNKAIKGSYKEIYGLPDATNSNKDALMAHLSYNMVSGDLQKGFFDKTTTMYSVKPGTGRRADDVDYSYLVPYNKIVDDARKAIYNAEQIERPTSRQGTFKRICGWLMSKLSFNFGWAKTYNEDQRLLSEWRSKTDLPKEKEILRKYNEAIDYAESVVERVEQNVLTSKGTPTPSNIVMMESRSKDMGYTLDSENNKHSENSKINIINMESLVEKNNKEKDIIKEDPKPEVINTSGKKISKITMYAREMEQQKLLKKQNVL